MPDDPRSPYDLDRAIPPTPTPTPDSIVGGEETRDFPDCAALGNDQVFFCSGTLIAPTVVVSARHCATDAGLGEPTRVFLQGYDVARPDTGETMGVKRLFTHPRADLLLLVLERPSTVRPRPIAQGHLVAATEATLVGFGTVDFNGRRGYGVKRRVDGIPIASLQCEEDESRIRYGCQPWEMVAGHRGLSRDTCKGDSGGPLYIQGPTGEYYLLGATSRGVRGGRRPCGDGGIYVRVDQFIAWIEEKTGVRLDRAGLEQTE